LQTTLLKSPVREAAMQNVMRAAKKRKDCRAKWKLFGMKLSQNSVPC
jgi:hypothetical protein